MLELEPVRLVLALGFRHRNVIMDLSCPIYDANLQLKQVLQNKTKTASTTGSIPAARPLNLK